MGFNRPQLPERAVRINDKIAYQWMCDHADPAEHTIECLRVWHWCDHHLWAGRSGYDAEPELYVRWVPASADRHDFISAEPLHLEPSVYWPECCGTHGFIRDGQWIPA